MSNKCLGCGAILQNTNESQVGYTPHSSTKKGYCKRCFRLIHYNEVSITDVLKDEEFILNEISNNADIALYIIDFLNISNEVLDKFKSLVCPKILLINKADLIPTSIKEEKIINWLKTEYQIKEKVSFLSAKKNKGINALIELINESKAKKVYIAGYTNSGKSTLLNCLCKKYNLKEKLITTSPIPNTTLDFINIKINQDLTIIDSPGFIFNETFYVNDEFDLIKKLNPKNALKPLTYQLKPNASIIIENKVRIENKSNQKISFTLYISNELNIKVVYSNNKSLTNNSYRVMVMKKNQDLVIKNVGFINIKEACELNVYTSNFEVYEIRNSFF